MHKITTVVFAALLLALCGCGGGSFSVPGTSREHVQPMTAMPGMACNEGASGCAEKPRTVGAPVPAHLPATREAGTPDFCTGGVLDQGAPLNQQGPDLVISNMTCTVDGSHAPYNFHNVYILGSGGSTGSLVFNDATMDFYAENILVQNGGVLQATGIGANNDGNVLTIHLYGPPSDSGVICQKMNNGMPVNDDTCGVPTSNPDVWDSNMMNMQFPASCEKTSQLSPPTTLPGGVDDCFYQYNVFDSGDVSGAYFGHKVLALSYGGTINFSGYKGAQGGNDNYPSVNSTSWLRLNATLNGGGTENSLTVSGTPADWKSGDNIIVTSTDYLPRHSEQLQVASVSNSTVNLQNGAVRYPHWGVPYSLASVPCDAPEGTTDCEIGPELLSPQQDPNTRNLDMRAAVGLLSRSIRIVSNGDTANQQLPTSGPDGYFGGHTVVRQGFLSYQIQGVEFYQLGQGGSIGHYPVHFHMARKVPTGTYVKDSSMWDSMTRWITVHATQNVTLARNVGYKSIGHGFYLEDGSETDNVLNTNLGVLTQAAVQNTMLNARGVPGILAAPGSPTEPGQPVQSDWKNPTVFWIMNGWNDFQYNFASSATTCGVCYWDLPGGISGPSRKEFFEGYAGEQTMAPGGAGHAGWAPLKKFVGNSCSTAMFSFLDVGSIDSVCLGVTNLGYPQWLQAVPSTAPVQNNPATQDPFYPYVTGLLKPTQCPLNAQGEEVCPAIPCGDSSPPQLENCVVTTIDRYTTSYNWASKNFSAMWLRRWWFLVENTGITDVQQGGLTFVTGGGYTRSELAQGYWSLLYKSAIVGNTQAMNGKPANSYAWSAGPFNPSGLSCDNQRADFCLSANQGISYPIDSNQANQRFLNIYDGPSHEERNAFLDIPTSQLGSSSAQGKCEITGGGVQRTCPGFGYLYGNEIGVPVDSSGNCYLANAAIAWKQSNGFYYPPAFHSDKLYFQNVDIRHFVIEPLLNYGTFVTNANQVQNRYCTWRTDMFNNFTDIDRQTVLNDDDGYLTGLLADLGGTNVRETISVNRPYGTDPGFYNDPKVTVQCASDLHGTTCPPGTANTSPNEYVTTGMIAQCGINGGGCRQGGFPAGQDCSDGRYFRPPTTYCAWGNQCSAGSGPTSCYGVPLYRQYLTEQEFTQYTKSPTTYKRPTIRMMGQGNGQRSTLTVNHGLYYIDDQVTLNTQWKNNGVANSMFNIFFPDTTYYVYFVYAKASLDQTYQMFVGYGLNESDVIASVKPYRAFFPGDNFQFQPASGASFLTVTYDNRPQSMGGTGLVTVTVNLSAYSGEFAGDIPQFCQPATYCTPNGSQCECAANSGCTDSSVCSWAIKDMDCPINGCFAFGITMPGSFETGIAVPPKPVKYSSDPNYDQNWLTPYKYQGLDSGAQCTYTSQPPLLCNGQ